MLTFSYTGADGRMTVEEILTSGMVGKQVRFQFSGDWDALRKTVVYTAGERCIVKTDIEEVDTIPAEVLEIPLKKLCVGIYGVSADGALVIPTIRAMGPTILPGCDPSGDAAADPTLPIWAQLQAAIGDPGDLQTDQKSDLVAAINEVVSKGADGTFFTPSVSADGTLSWTNNGWLKNPDPVNLRGEKGDKGEQGEPGAQQVPLFANSVSECTDTEKVYVLPDGYLYAYMLTTEYLPAYTNMVPASIAADGSVYNGGLGYKADYRLSSSGGESALSGAVVSGFIPVKSGDVIRAYGADSSAAGMSNNTSGFYVNGYNAAFTFVEYLSPTDAAGNDGVFDKSGDHVLWTVDTALFGTMPAYVRVSMPLCAAADFVVTINEEITGERYTAVTKQAWTNTGHAFVPADYEDRITALEECTEALQGDMDTLEAESTGVADYVIAEADRVSKAVLSKQNANTFTFLAISDMHHLLSDAQSVASSTHAGQGMDLVRRGCHIDFAAVLGDNGWGSGQAGSQTSIADGIEELREANKYIDAGLRGIPNFRTPGNHCGLVYNYAANGNAYIRGSELFPLYGAYNSGAVYPAGEKSRGYCCRDFEEFRLRVICLNTSDVDDVAESEGKSIYISGTQLKWFAETLDLSGKEEPGQWQILLLGHAPLDWGDCIASTQILKAYLEGGSVSMTRDGVTVSYDYSGKNSAAVIGQIHGHIHNFKVDHLHYLDAAGTAQPLTIQRIAIPNACFSRNNEYGSNGATETNGIEFGETSTFGKTAGTAEDTAFCVVTVDTAARHVDVTHYGAGYDREMAY